MHTKNFTEQATPLIRHFLEAIRQHVHLQMIQEFCKYGITPDDTFGRRMSGVLELLAREPIDPQERERLLQKVRTYMSAPNPNVTPEEGLPIIELAGANVARTIGHALFAALSQAVTNSNAGSWLRTDTLDDAMLPRSNPAADAAFEKSINEGRGCVTVQEARAMLGTLRTSLQKRGQHLPAELVTYLQFIGIQVI